MAFIPGGSMREAERYDPGKFALSGALALEQSRANAQLGAANIAAQTQRYGYDQNFKGQKYTTDANVGINSVNNATQRYGIDQSVAAQRYGYEQNLKSALGVADRNAAAQKYSSDVAAKSQKYSSDNALSATLGSASMAAASERYASDNAYKSSIYGSDASKAAAQYQADQSLAAALANVGGQNERFQKGLDWSKDKFGQVFGYIQNQMGGLGGSSTPAAIDYASAPTIDTSPVFTPRQINENVNNAVGLIDQRTASQAANLARSGAARGIGSRQSPLILALQGQNQSIGAGQAADAALNFQTNAAGKNAEQRLASQQAAAQAWNQQQNLKLQGQKNILDFQGSLLAALAGLGASA